MLLIQSRLKSLVKKKKKKKLILHQTTMIKMIMSMLL